MSDLASLALSTHPELTLLSWVCSMTAFLQREDTAGWGWAGTGTPPPEDVRALIHLGNTGGRSEPLETAGPFGPAFTMVPQVQDWEAPSWFSCQSPLSWVSPSQVGKASCLAMQVAATLSSGQGTGCLPPVVTAHLAWAHAGSHSDGVWPGYRVPAECRWHI